MISKRIVYTRHDGGISVCCPSEEIFQVMQMGGYWNDRPRGFVQAQIDRQIADGIKPSHAVRFAHAVAFGGVTEAGAWGIIKDRDCERHGYNFDLFRVDDIPRDRWFRNAWSRSPNGGPIAIALEKARPIQWQRIVAAAKSKNSEREFEFNLDFSPINLDTLSLKSAIRHARDEHELRAVWPDELRRTA